MDCKKLLWIVLFCAFFSRSFSVNCNKERRCRTQRVHGFKTSDCFNMEWKELPKCLPSDVEVLELSYNRIRKISHTDLQRYPYITHLYLTDNLLVNLEDDLFQHHTNLETLDLSVNALVKVPHSVFHLPNLKTLYLSQNLNINIAESIEDAKPIGMSSLTKLDMSYVTEEGMPADFPDFAELPYLAFLNITGDQFTFLSTKHFAGLCNLQILANINVTTDFERNCDCWKINQWLTDRKIQFSSFLCPANENECLNEEINPEDLNIYQACRQKFEDTERSILLGKVGIGIGVAIGFKLLVVAIFFYRRWKRRLRERKSQQRVDSQRKDSIQLLNNDKA